MVILLFSTSAMADNTIGGFYDAERRLWIGEHNWFVPLGGAWKAFGFNEIYRLPAEGFPSEKNVWFGKTWIMREVSPSLSIGVEIEHGYNNAGMFKRSDPFKQDQFRVIPKIGLQWKLN